MEEGLLEADRSLRKEFEIEYEHLANGSVNCETTSAGSS